MNNNHVSIKIDTLKSLIRPLAPLAVAFSGGVDSTFLLWIAYEIHGRNVLAIVAKSPVFPKCEEELALGFLEKREIPYIVIEPPLMEDSKFTRNHNDRCYFCKKKMFGCIMDKAAESGITHVAHGVNTDDYSDYRPGLKASREMGILNPLADAGFSKDDIREASRILGLPSADLPSMACLASRIPYGLPLTCDVLMTVERSESMLMELGFSGVRARHHGELVRIEIPETSFERIIDPLIRKTLVEKLKSLGYLYVSLDLEGYSQGSMNRAVKV